MSTREDRTGHTILLVEDDDAVRGVLRQLLEKNGYRVLDSPNASHAFQLAHAHDGPIHLLLTDVVLPNLDGREVADHIIMVRPGIRVVFMSGYDQDEVLHHGVFSDGINFLQKPFEPEALLKKVRASLS